MPTVEFIEAATMDFWGVRNGSSKANGSLKYPQQVTRGATNDFEVFATSFQEGAHDLFSKMSVS